MIKVLVVDDSPTARYILSELINAEPDMEVIGEADNSTRVLSMVRNLDPDLILMDLFMPGFNGIDTTKAIMSQKPTPIVIISGVLSGIRNADTTVIQALRHGALAVINKPKDLLHAQSSDEAKIVIDTIRSMASVRVITHQQFQNSPRAARNVSLSSEYRGDAKIVAIGVSTGGPNTLLSIFKNLPADFPIPIVVVQHITGTFLEPLVDWLAASSKLKIRIAQDAQLALKGNIYFAPINYHLTLNKSGRFELLDNPKTLHMPSADFLFESVARVYGKNAIGLQLTGMGDDGVYGLKAMYEQSAYTIAQDEASSIVFGMPRAAIEAGAVHQVAALEDIAGLLEKLVEKNAN